MRRVVSCVPFLAVSLCCAVPSLNPSAAPLLEPSAAQVAVRNASELVAALGNAKPGQTLMLADGTYDLASVEPLRLRVDSVGVYGASRDPSKVILRGKGFGGSDTNEEMIKIEASANTLAYLTIRDVRANGLKIQTGANDDLLVHNVNFIDICERSIKGPDATVSLRGIVRYCLFEQETPITGAIPNLNSNGDYIAGMDMMKIEGWRIHDNTFKNIRGMNGGGRAAVFLWNGCKGVVVERNLFIGCDRAIAFGNPSGPASDMEDGIARNNFIVAGAGNAIEVCHSRSTSVLHNTVYSANPSYNRTLFFFENTAGNSVKNNLVMGKLFVESGTTPDTAGNLFVASAPGWFQNPSAGDLHLTQAATGALDKGVSFSHATDDFDGAARVGPPDIGADEFATGSRIRGMESIGAGARRHRGTLEFVRQGTCYGINGRRSCLSY
jgi:hypothetical protein